MSRRRRRIRAGGPAAAAGGDARRVPAPAVSPLRRAGTILLESARGLLIDNAFDRAAAIAFYTLLSIVPLLLGAASLAAWLVEPEWAVRETTRFLSAFVPEGHGLLRDTVGSLVRLRGGASLLSVAGLLWSGSQMFGVLTRALSAPYAAEKGESLPKRMLVETLLTGAFGALFALVLSTGFLLDLVTPTLRRLVRHGGVVVEVLEHAVPVLLVFGTLLLVYRFLPLRLVRWGAAASGAGVAATLFVVSRPFFVTYVHQFAGWNLVYGPLAVTIGLLFWAWVVAVIILYGGEVSARIQRAPVVERTRGCAKIPA